MCRSIVLLFQYFTKHLKCVRFNFILREKRGSSGLEETMAKGEHNLKFKFSLLNKMGGEDLVIDRLF